MKKYCTIILRDGGTINGQGFGEYVAPPGVNVTNNYLPTE